MALAPERLRWLGGAVAGWLLAGASAALAQSPDTFFVQVPAVLGADAPMPEAIRRECAVDALVGNYVLKEVSARYPGTQMAPGPEPAGAARFVRLTILAATGWGGGAYSGAKSMTIRAELQREGKTVDTTVLHRAGRGGALSAFVSTCQIMDRVAAALGKDTLLWLQGAMLRQAGSPIPPPSVPAPEPAKSTD